jgi:hypothetical protein
MARVKFPVFADDDNLLGENIQYVLSRQTHVLY